jgi:hypothetical protein
MLLKSAVGIATDYGLDGRGVGVRVPVGPRLLFSPRRPSYPMSTWDSFPGVKWLGREADHLPPISAEVKNAWVYTSNPPYVFMA